MLALSSLALSLAVVSPPPSSACLTGRALDVRGNPLLGAAISLVSAASVIRTTTGRDGAFEFVLTPTDALWLVAERLGFEPEIRRILATALL